MEKLKEGWEGGKWEEMKEGLCGGESLMDLSSCESCLSSSLSSSLSASSLFLVPLLSKMICMGPLEDFLRFVLKYCLNRDNVIYLKTKFEKKEKEKKKRERKRGDREFLF